MSFFDDQMDDWLANGCKGAPSDYYCGELGPWMDGKFTDTSVKAYCGIPDKKRSRSQKRRDQRKRAEARKKAEVTGLRSNGGLMCPSQPIKARKK